MFEIESFYDSDEGVASGPITFREEKARLKEKYFPNPTTNRRATAFGRLEQVFPKETKAMDYLTAETSGQTSEMISDSSSEDASNKEAISNIIKTLDNAISAEEVIEISDTEEESGFIYISSTSSSDNDQSNLSLTPSKPKINSSTSQQGTSSANTAKLSDSEILQELSALHLSSNHSLHSADESLLLQCTNDNDITDSVFANDELDRINENVNYKKQNDIPTESKNHKFSNDHTGEGIEHIHSLDQSKSPPEKSAFNCLSNESASAHCNDQKLLVTNEIKRITMDKIDFILNSGKPEEVTSLICLTSELASAPVDQIDKHRADEELLVTNEKLDSTLDKIDFILNSGNAEEDNRDCITPQRMIHVSVVESTPNSSIVASDKKKVTPFKVPTKIPRSLRKEFTATRCRFDNIKSPVAHYIKNTPYAPIIQNIQCREFTQKEWLEVLAVSPINKPKIQWPKVHLTEKRYIPAKVQIIPESDPGKIFKMPTNIAALTTDMGLIRRHLGRVETSKSRLPRPIFDNAELQDTFTAQSMSNEGEVSLISEKKTIIE